MLRKSREIFYPLAFGALLTLAHFAYQNQDVSHATLDALAASGVARGQTLPEPTETPMGETIPPTSTPVIPPLPPDVPPADGYNLNCQIDILAKDGVGRLVNGVVKVSEPNGYVRNTAGLQSLALKAGETTILVGENAHDVEIIDPGDPTEYEVSFLTGERLPPGYQIGCNPEANPIIVQTEVSTNTSEIEIFLDEQNTQSSASQVFATDTQTRTISVTANNVQHQLNEEVIGIESQSPIKTIFTRNQSGNMVTDLAGNAEAVVNISSTSGNREIHLPQALVSEGLIFSSDDNGMLIINEKPITDSNNDGTISQEEVIDQVTRGTINLFLPLVTK